MRLERLTRGLWGYRDRFSVSPAEPIRTFVVAPYAGGSAYSMTDLLRQLVAEEENALVLQYPGRGPRIDEPPADSLNDLADQAALDVARHSSGSLVLFGHSMGGVVSFELAHRLESAGREVELLVISAARHPALTGLNAADVTAKSNEEWIAILRSEFGVTDEALGVPMMLDIAIRTLRSDYLLLASHPWRHRQLACPLLLIGGDMDADVTRAHLRAWEDVTADKATTHMLSGGHFYHRDRAPELCAVIRQSLRLCRCGGLGSAAAAEFEGV